MRARPAAALVILALVIALLTALALLRPGSVEKRRSPPPPSSSVAEPPPPPLLRGAPEPRAAIPAPPPGGDAGEEEPVPTDTDAILLSGTVRVAGTAAEVSFDPSLEISIGPAVRFTAAIQVPPARATLRTSGAFRVDLRPVIRGMVENEDEPELWLRIDHRGYVPIVLPVPIADPAEILFEARTLEPISLELQPARVIAGVVRLPSGGPCDGADVSVYPFPREAPEPSWIATDQTDAFGAFGVRLAEDGRYLVVATWGPAHGSRGGPAHQVCEVARATPVTDLQLALGLVHAVRGTVHCEGRPLAKARITCRLAEDGISLSSPQGGLCWTGRSVQWTGTATDVDDAGRFEIHGLASLTHELRVEWAPGFHAHRRTTGSSVREVVPPRDGVEFDLRLARVDVRVTADGPLDSLIVGMTDMGMAPEFGEDADDVVWGTTWHELTEDGRASVLLSPGCKYMVTVEEERNDTVVYETFYERFRAPVAGEVRVIQAHLDPVRPKPELVVTLEGEGAEELSLAGFAFWEPEVSVRSESPYPIRPRVERGPDGTYHLKELMPGPWRLHVRPGRGWHDPPGAWAESIQPTHVPEEGVARVVVQVRKGGRLHLHVTDTDGRYLPASCTIHDARGREVEAEFRAESAEGPLRALHMSARTLADIGPNWVEPVLVPGTYDIALRLDGYERVEREVELKPGLPTAVRVVLKRLP